MGTEIKQNLHMKLELTVLGIDGLNMELNYSFTDLATVKLVRAAVVQALLALDK